MKNHITKFMLLFAFWFGLSYLPIAINDYDFLEAIPWWERQTALMSYFVWACMKSTLFAVISSSVTRNYVKNRVIVLLIALLITGIVTFCLYFYLFSEKESDPTFVAFYANVFVSRNLRYCLDFILIILCVLFVKRKITERYHKITRSPHQ
jgi:Kef-type K+ transport system membrane component KefB